MEETDRETLFLNWVDRYQNLILSVCYHMTQDYFAAQDLTQETFLAAFLHLNGFDGRNEKAWLCRIASNKCVDYLKQAGRRLIPTEDTQMDTFYSPAGKPEGEALERAVHRELLERCRSLKPPYDEIAYQYFYLEKRPDEIAREQGRNKKTVETQIYRAREMLRKIYRDEREAPGGRRALEQGKTTQGREPSGGKQISGNVRGKERQNG